MAASNLLASPVDLNGPGHYLHWSIFTVSEANLVLIAVMVVIFGVALLLPFPHGRDVIDLSSGKDQGGGYVAAPADGATSRMWTSRLRRWGLRNLPPDKLLPDKQPAYVSSWVYVFGVGSLAALGVAIVSGFAIALGGPDWWHTNATGHFFNSLHLWSVELFMALLVIHLWGKFWMAAWRGRRGATWVTGVVAFAASVLECFTGYLSQQNFDSQWIATNGKDAMNATGIGAFFNLTNFGQMLMWHIVLIPILLIAIIGAHVLLVRVRGVSHPLPEKMVRGRAARKQEAAADAAEWRGPKRRYDIIKEGVAAAAVVTVAVVALAGLLSSPDVPSISVKSWAQVAPDDFLGTAASELAGTSETANYGPPYNHGTANVQRLGFSMQAIVGVHQPIDAARTFVLTPLSKLTPDDPRLAAALATYNRASTKQQQAWANAYSDGVTKVTFSGGTPVLPPGDYGPVATMLSTELSLARSGAIDADLLAERPFYGTNFTKPLLFLEDGSYYSDQAKAMHLTGSQWGVMNETGSYPGQPWLWLYTLWYQVRPFKNSANVDLMAIYLTGAATILLLAVPWLPGLRDIPRLIPVHRLVWKDWNRWEKEGPKDTGPTSTVDHDAYTPGPFEESFEPSRTTAPE
jgi:hypothetical protein